MDFYVAVITTTLFLGFIRADITQDIFVNEGTPPGTLIGKLGSNNPDIPAPPYIIMAYQESVERDFSVNENTGEILTQVLIDRELTDFYSFMAVPLMGGANVRVRITVRDINDHSPTFKEELVNLEFSESQPRDTRRSLPPASDPDVGINTTQRYEIVSGNINNVFRVSSRRGRDGTLYLDLEINGVLDRETIDNYMLTIEAFDGGSPPRSGRLKVNVTLLDDNDNQPLFSETRYHASIPENATVETFVLQVDASDADFGRNGQIAYFINRRLSDGEHFFDVDPASGVVRLNKVLDYEKRASYELVITARDNGTQPLESSTFVYIDVINVNDQPPRVDVVFLNNATARVAESALVGDFVARLSVSDEDSAQQPKIVLTMTAGMDKFDLVSGEIPLVYMLRVKNSLDFETATNHTISVRASDAGEPPLVTEKAITIFVQDVNDNAPVFDKSIYSVDVSESVDNGTVLLHVSASDADSGDNALVEYFLVPGSPGNTKVRVDPTTGIVNAATQFGCQRDLNLENVVIGARDRGVPSRTSTAVVQMSFRSDNEDVAVFEKPLYNVTLNMEDVAIGKCFVQVHVERSGCAASAEIHYGFHASWSDDYFEINPKTGQICTKRAFDHQVAPLRQLLVQATDKDNKSTTAFVQIYLPPSLVFKSNYFITDTFHATVSNIAPPNTPVVQVRPDVTPLDGWTFVYAFAEGRSDYQPFQVDSSSGLIRVAKSLQDHLGQYNLLINVRETTSNLTVGQIQVFVKVLLQEPYLTARLYKLTISEDASVGTTAGKVDVLPEHAGVKFSIQAPESSFFEVDYDSGMVRTTGLLDGGVLRFHSFIVVAQYTNRDLQDFAQVLISLADHSDHQPAFRSSQVDLHVAENAATGAPIFQAIASASDSLPRKRFRYLITSGDQSHFHLDEITGILSISKPLDYESARTHKLIIDGLEIGSSKPIQASIVLNITVTDCNDHAPVFALATYYVETSESTPLDTVLVKVTATDADSGKSGKLLYHIDGSSNVEHVFGIFPQTGEVYLRQKLDREKQDVYTFGVFAADQGRPPFRVPTTVEITVTDDNDCSPVFGSNSYNFTISENGFGKNFVGKVQAKDQDLGNNSVVTYRLTCNDSYFEIDQETGEIFAKKPLDREELSVYNCIVTVRDSGEPSRESSVPVTISVADTNDHSPVFLLPMDDVIWVSEGEPEGTEIIKVYAKDADHGDNGKITYSLSPDEDSAAFSVHAATGTVRSEVVLDHEKQSLYRLVVVATDRGTPVKSAKKVITVNVADVNDNRPTFSSNVITIEVTEGTPAGVEIGAVLALDADSGENGRVSYSIIRGNVFGTFDIGRTSGKIYTAREVDYELAPSYTMRIRAVDNSSVKPRSNLVVVNVIVIDVNDCSPKFSSDTCLFSVIENTPVGTNVWNFSASDGDSGSFGQVLFEIPYQSPQMVFKIHPITGALTVAEKIDFERHKEYSFVVTAWDRDPEKTGRKSASLKCHVVVQDENDYAPKFVSRNFVRISEEVEHGYPVTQMVALDEDSFNNGNVTYEITRGNEERIFMLSESTGMITLNRTSAQLKTKSYSLTIVATDNGTPKLATMQVLTIEIDSVSNKIQVFNQSVYEFDLIEDVDLGTIVLSFPNVQNWNHSVRFNIPEEFLYGKFAVDTDTGELRVTHDLDRESRDLYTMNIYATNKLNPSLYDFATIIIGVLDVNDNAPSFQDSCHGLSIPENNEFGPVHKFIATDRDIDQNAKISYRIESGNLDQKFFINPQNGELSSKPLDREEEDEYTLLVVAEDHGRPSKQTVCRLRISVLDRNDNIPVFTSLSYSLHIPEGIPIGYNVVQVRATDKDADENARITYSLKNDTRGLLRINDVTGLITTAGLFDYEVLTEYRVEVVATDNSKTFAQSSKILLELFIDDVNDNGPEFSRFRYESKVADAVKKGQPVAQVFASDKDVGQNSEVTYSFGKPEKKFEIDAQTGVVTAKDDLLPDGAPGSMYRMTVVAKDQGKEVQRSSMGMLDIMVGDEPSSTVNLKFANSTYKVAVTENALIGTELLTVKAIRSDGKVSNVAYSIFEGNAARVFDINKQSGLIFVRDSSELDYERHKMFNLTILAEESSGSAEKLQTYVVVSVTVTDENDNAPQFGQNKYSSSVFEGNNKGTFVTQLVASDEDSGVNSMLTYEIVDGNYDGAFVIEPPFSGIVKTNIILDREIHASYRLVIVAKDSGVPQKTGTCTLKISIADVNDNDPVFPNYEPVFVSEGASVGSVIFTVAANDVDISPSVTYSLPPSGNGKGTFSIDPFSGKIAMAAPLDREKKDRYQLVVEASDKLHHTRMNLTVIVKDENDNAPVFSQSEYKVSVSELTPPGATVLTLPASDADEGNNAKIKYYIKIAPVEGFKIGEDTGIITTTKTVAFDPTNPLIHLVVSAEDQGNPKLSSIAAVQIQITGVNRNAPVFNRTVYSVYVPEDVPMGQTILQVSAHDPDSAVGTSSVRFSIQSGDPDSNFQVDDQTGKIIVVKRLDREITPTYFLKLTASDHGRPVRNSTAEAFVYVNDVNDYAPQFNQTEYKVLVNEDIRPGSSVLQVKATDLDAGENATVTYSIISGNQDNLFSINEATGVIQVVKGLDYETKYEHKLMIQAADCGLAKSLSNVVAAIIVVQDVNDNAPFFAVDHYAESIPENSPIGTLIFTARAHDHDQGSHGRLRYSITSGEGIKEFAIDGSTGTVTTKVVLDYELTQVYNFIVTATDNSGSRADIQVTVTIESKDDFSPKFKQSDYRFYIPPQSKKGTFIGQVSAEDRDAGPDGRVLYSISGRPSEMFSLNTSTGVIMLLEDLHVDNSSASPSQGSFVVSAVSGIPDSKTDATLVVVVFGSPLQDTSSSAAYHGTTVVAGVVSGAIAFFIVLVVGVGCCVRLRMRKTRRQQYSNSFGVLQYSAFQGIENGTHRPEGNNHYQDPQSGMSHLPSDISSGRGSVDDEEVRVILDGQYYTGSRRIQKGLFPKMMPDSGLPDGGDYSKVAIPASGPGSSESIHRFDVEGGREFDGSELYHKSSDHEQRSHASSNSSASSRYPRRLDRDLETEMLRNNNLEYLMWVPQYSPMAAVYAEIAEFPDSPSGHSPSSMFRNYPFSESQHNSSSSPSIYLSKSSSQTTLPSGHLMMGHEGNRVNRGNHSSRNQGTSIHLPHKASQPFVVRK